MSFLRRRFGGAHDDSPIESREPSPAPGQPRPSNLRVITAEQLHTLKKKGKSKRKNAWIFGLGGLFGLVVAGFFASSNEMIDLKSLEGMNLDSILDALPASFVSSAQQLQVSRGTSESWMRASEVFLEVLRRVLSSSTQ
jgi:phospholipid:diacylglycerol acyltransferase